MAVNIEPYHSPRVEHLFDLYPRDNWFAFRDAGNRVGKYDEVEVDETSRQMEAVS